MEWTLPQRCASSAKKLPLMTKSKPLMTESIPWRLVTSSVVHVQENDLRKIFEPFGELDFIQLAKDGSGNSQGYGYVQYVLRSQSSSLKSVYILLHHWKFPLPHPFQGRKENIDLLLSGGGNMLACFCVMQVCTLC